MVILVSDVGGTNARLALALDGVIFPETITRFRGEDYGGFVEVLRHYLDQQGNPEIESVCVAVAGPVSNGRARLTNRAWNFSETELRNATGAARALLINDMIALGYAAASDAAIGNRPLRVCDATASGNGQKLVVNAGTGFNVCAVRQIPGNDAVCFEAEEGHATLPLSVWTVLVEHCAASGRLAEFTTNETLFSGRGLALLHDVLHGGGVCRAEDVVAAAEAGDAAAVRTGVLYARMFGLLCRDLALRFMPRDGLYLAGSVARSATRETDHFLQAFSTGTSVIDIIPNVAITVVENDMIALQGCIAAANPKET